MSEDKNMHNGHRKRLVATATDGDFNSLSEIQQLEMLLFFIVPRVDTNPIAHRLIDHFGSFAGVLDASVEELSAMKGLGEATAKKIKIILKLINKYTDSKIERKLKFSKLGDILDYIEEMLRTKDFEETHAFALNSMGFCSAKRLIAAGDWGSVSAPIKKIFQFIDSSKASSIIVVHNHPDMKAVPSEKDLTAYNQLKISVEAYGCSLYDSYILGVDGIYSMGSQRLVRNFELSDCIKKIEKYKK